MTARRDCVLAFGVLPLLPLALGLHADSRLLTNIEVPTYDYFSYIYDVLQL